MCAWASCRTCPTPAADARRSPGRGRRFRRPTPGAIGEAPHYAIDEVALHSALEENPTIQVSRSAVQRAEAEVDAARAAKRPDWSWEVAYQRRDPMFGDMVMAGVTVSLPIFAS